MSNMRCSRKRLKLVRGGGQVADAEDSLACRRCRVGEPSDPGLRVCSLWPLGTERVRRSRGSHRLCRAAGRSPDGTRAVAWGWGGDRSGPPRESGVGVRAAGVCGGVQVLLCGGEGTGRQSRGRHRECCFQGHLNRRPKSKSWT